MSDELDLDLLHSLETPKPRAAHRASVVASAGARYDEILMPAPRASKESSKGFSPTWRPMLVLVETLREFIMSKQWMYAGASLAVVVVAGTVGLAYMREVEQQSLSEQMDRMSMQFDKVVQGDAPAGSEVPSVRATPTQQMELSAAPPADMPIALPKPSVLARPSIQQDASGGGTTAGAMVDMSGNSASQLAFETPPMAPMPSPREMARSTSSMSVSSPVMPYPDMPPTVFVPQGQDEFVKFAESPLKSTAVEPVSTFSTDVDTASYSFVRKMLEQGVVPPSDAVRIEEMVNYFPYDYAPPADGETPFSTAVSVYPTPWNPDTRILHIGIKGYVPPAEERKPVSLTFLVDTSGSMEQPDKLPLLQRSLLLLLDTLDEHDTVAIVAYAGSAGLVLEPTPASDKARISRALNDLYAGGSTAGAAGIELAYQVADEARVEGGVNRVVLATDGDFNVGIDDPDELKDFIAKKRDTGISLSVLGFGMGNLGDDTMQVLAQNGNGNASYIGDFTEARKVLVEEVGGTLETIAKDVKIQIEFNPAVVSEYRLIGYETRALNREDFNNDKVDAGDIGAGHTVTALYEIVAPGSKAELLDPLRYGAKDKDAAATTSMAEIGFLKLRYKLPNEDDSRLIEVPVPTSIALDTVDEASDDMRFAAAVAAFGQKLRGSVHDAMSWEDIRSLASGARGQDDGGYRAEFLRVIDDARSLTEAYGMGRTDAGASEAVPMPVDASRVPGPPISGPYAIPPVSQ